MGINKKIIVNLILTIILMLSLSLIVLYAATEEDTEETIDKKLSYPSISEILPEEQVTTNGGIYITHEDLLNYPSIFCSAKGTALPGKNSATLTVNGKTYTQTDQGSKLAYLTTYNKGETIANTNSWTGPVASMNNPYSAMTSKTYAKFQVSEIRRATPAEAWVLAEMDQNDPSKNAIEYTITDEEYTGEVNEEYKYEGEDSTELWAVEWDENSLEPTRFVTKKDNKYYYVECSSYAPYTYVQHAWWNVKTVGTTNKSGVQDTDLADEAEAFYDYIVDVTSYNHDTATSREDFTTDESNDGNFNENNTVKIDYKVKMDSSKVEVLYDAETNKYRIGPLTVDYLRSIVKCGAREPVSFSGISNSVLVGKKADDTEVTIDKDAYRFVYEHDHQKYREETLNNTIDTDETYPYPYANEEFYIELDYQDDIVALTSFKFDFQYVTAGGEFELLEGNYLIITWSPWCSWTVGGSTSGSGPTAQVERMLATTELAKLDVTSRANTQSTDGASGSSSGGGNITVEKEDGTSCLYQDDVKGGPTVGGAKGDALLHKEDEDEDTITLKYTVKAPEETSQNWFPVDEYDDNGDYRYGSSELHKRYKINDVSVESIKGDDGKEYTEGTDYTVATINDSETNRVIEIKINKKKGYFYDALDIKFKVIGTTEKRLTYSITEGSKKPSSPWSPIDGENKHEYVTRVYEMEYAQDVIDAYDLSETESTYTKNGDAYVGKLGIIENSGEELTITAKLKDNASEFGKPGKVMYTYSTSPEAFSGPTETKNLENKFYLIYTGDYTVCVTTYTSDGRAIYQYTFDVKAPKMYINTTKTKTDSDKTSVKVNISNETPNEIYIYNAVQYINPGKLKTSGDEESIDFIEVHSITDWNYRFWINGYPISSEKIDEVYGGIAEQSGEITFTDYGNNKVKVTVNASLMSEGTLEEKNAPKSLSITGLSKLKVNGQTTYRAKANGKILSDVAWTSSDTSLATIDTNGSLTALGEGEVTITATSLEYEISGSKKITIGSKSKKDIEVTGVTLKLDKTSIVEGTIAVASATVSPAGATNSTVNYSSSNTGVATITQQGVITGVSAGKSTITVEAGGKKDTATITVTKNTTGTNSEEILNQVNELLNKINEYASKDYSGSTAEDVQKVISELESIKSQINDLKNKADTLGDSSAKAAAITANTAVDTIINGLRALISGLSQGQEVPPDSTLPGTGGQNSGNGGSSSTVSPYTYSLNGNVLYNFNYYLKYTDESEQVAQTLINGREAEKKDVDAGYGAGDSESGDPVSIEFLPDGMEIDLTTSVGGMVWEDAEPFVKGEESKADGIFNEADGDKKLSKIEVRIWKVVYELKDNAYVEVTSEDHARTLADAYRTKTVSEDGSIKLEDKIDFESDDKAKRLFTDDNGDYKVYLNIPAIEGLDPEKYKVSYDVEFIYDGQTYEVTEYLASTGETETAKKVEKFESTSATPDGAGENPNPVDYSAYANDSYAIETYDERYAYDTKFTEVYGKEEIKSDGTTKGAASNPDAENSEELELNYTSSDKGFDEIPSEETNVENNVDTNNETNNAQTRKESTLVTKDNEGYIYDQYGMKARTSTAGLLLPYEDRIHVEDKKEDIPLEYIDTGAVGQFTYYKPINEYFSHINLGLVNRDHSDVTVSQDLYKAGITVNQDDLTYKYSALIDLEDEKYADKLNMLLDMQNSGVAYEIGLYASDFYYRSDVYKADYQTEVIKDVIDQAKQESELRLFATYKISVYNDSDNQDVSINKLNDYFDSTYTLITEEVKTKIEDENGVREEQVVAEPSYFRIYNPLGANLEESPYHYNMKEDLEAGLTRVNRTEEESEKMVTGQVTWTIDESENGLREVKGTDEAPGGEYRKMTTETFKTTTADGGKRVTNELTLRPGEKLEIFVSFEVDRQGYNEATTEEYEESKEEKDKTRADLLGGKNNVAEVANYTTFYTEESLGKNNNVAYKAGEVSGKVDKDSAADNVNFEMTEVVENNGAKYTVLDKKWLEDDTETAPVFRVFIRDKDTSKRSINGIVWDEELSEKVDGVENTSTGDGKYTEGEKGIPGVTVTLVEKIKISEEEATLEDGRNIPAGEYEYVWPDGAFSDAIPGYTSVTMSDKDGKYQLENFVSGNYVVRFEYGNTALTMDYNGQDYKNTSYQEGIVNPSEDTINENFKEEHKNNDQTTPELIEQMTLNNEWHDLTGVTEGLTNSENEQRVSDARDYEARRLGIIGFTRTINNSTAEILAVADSQELKDLKQAILNEMNKESDAAKTYQEALERVKKSDERLKAFVESDEYKALIEYTSMEANTSKLRVQIEDSSDLDFGVTKKSTGGAFTVNVGGTYDQILDAMKNDPENVKKEHTINNIDFGLERRPDTIIQLDKYLQRIELQKENEPIFRLVLNRSGEIQTEQSIGNESLLSLEESEGTQGFRYINMEEDYLRNTRIFVDYEIAVTNKSEVDYASSKLVNETYTDEKLDDYIDTINANSVSGEGIRYGEYAGLFYYTHDKNAINEDYTVAGGTYRDDAVRTTVDSVVDYIDPSINLAEGLSNWESAGNDGEAGKRFESLEGLISDDSYTEQKPENNQADNTETKYYLQDNDGNLYMSESRANLATTTNDGLDRNMKTTPQLERGSKGEGQLRYEVKTDDSDEDDENGKANDMGQKAYSNEQVIVENILSYKNNTYEPTTHNKDLTKELSTINLGDEKADDKPTSGSVVVNTTADVTNDLSMDDMIYDNLAEVLVYSNSVGRRTMAAIPGNAFEIVKQNVNDSSLQSAGGGIWNAGHSSNPAKDEKILEDLIAEYSKPIEYTQTAKYAFNTKEALAERNKPEETGKYIAELDADAAEYVTFTEPTGLSKTMQNQTVFIIAMLIALIVLAVGIIVITLRVVMVKSTDDVTIESTKE